jgi:hypothetical protein
MVKNDEWVNKKTEKAIASGASIRAEIETPLRMVLIFDICSIKSSMRFKMSVLFDVISLLSS